MSSTDEFHTILDQLLDNALELKETDDALPVTVLLDHQNRLLDSLFHQWDALTEEERAQALHSKLELKIEQLAKRNQERLKKF